MSSRKRVLIITYYWPPSAGSGVQRWLKFAKYLPECGWEPVVFTPENPDFDLKDPSLEKEVPKEVEVLKFPIWEPYQLLRTVKKGKTSDPAIIMEKGDKSFIDRMAIWLRANVLVPDPRVFWVKPAVNFLLGVMEQNDIKAVITTGPPHSMHLIGRDLKRKTGITWLADFRDPWTTWEFLDTLPMIAWIRSLHRKLEASVFREANALITISPTFKLEMEAIAQRGMEVLTNGFDPDDLPKGFRGLSPEQEIFEVVYSGVIDAIRNPIPFLSVFKHVFEGNPFPVRMTFVGKVSSLVRNTVENDEWLSSHVVFAGYVSHSTVFDYYEKAHLLLLILTDTKNAKGNIPGKLFEYLATGRRILALGDSSGDTAEILHGMGTGRVVSHRSDKEIEMFLINAFEHRMLPLAEGAMEKYSRKHITRELAFLLDKHADTVS